MAAEHFSPNFSSSCFFGALVVLRLGFYDFRLPREERAFFRTFRISRCYDCWASYFFRFLRQLGGKTRRGSFFLRWVEVLMAAYVKRFAATKGRRPYDFAAVRAKDRKLFMTLRNEYSPGRSNEYGFCLFLCDSVCSAMPLHPCERGGFLWRTGDSMFCFVLRLNEFGS